MVAAKRDLRNPGVAYSHGRHSAEDFRVVKGDVLSLTTSVVNSEANMSADCAFRIYSEALKDTVSPVECKLSVFEAFSKLDVSSSLGSRTLVAVRLLTSEDKTRGLRVLAFSVSKDQKYGSKVGYKRIPLDSFKLKDEESTRVFTAVSKQIGLEISCYENSNVLVLQASGRCKDDAYCCQTVVEYCVSKTINPVFRAGLPRTNDPVKSTLAPERRVKAK